LEDLKIEAYKWITAGEQVIIMLDANGDVRDGEIQQMFSELGMREAIIELHENLPATSTFAHNQQEVPIDGIFATLTVCLQGGGYFPFGEGPGNEH
jgi:hypothetical protein